MTPIEQQEANDSAHDAGAAIARCMLRIGSDAGASSLIVALLQIADRYEKEHDVVALNVVAGALAALEHTYRFRQRSQSTG